MTNPTYDEPEFVLGEYVERPKYDVYYFIRKFAAIPEDNNLYNLDIGVVLQLEHLLLTLSDMSVYRQSTPKRRILAALRDVACRELGDTE